MFTWRQQLVALWSWPTRPLGDGADLESLSDLEVATYCATELCRALLGMGLSVHRIAETIQRLGRANGYEVDSLVLPTCVVVSARRNGEQLTRIASAVPGLTDVAQLVDLYRLVTRIERGELDARATLREIRAITARPPHYGPKTAVASCGVVGAASALLSGSGLAGVGAAGGLGLAVGLLFALSASYDVFGRLLPLLGGACAGLVTFGLNRAGAPLDAPVVLVSALLILLPGQSTTTAIFELAQGHLISGTSRLAGAATSLVQLGFGVLIGNRLGALVPAGAPLPGQPQPEWLATAALPIAAMSFALGFSLLVSIRPRSFPAVIGLCLATTYLARAVGQLSGPAEGAFVGATLVAVASHVYSHVRDVPVSLLAVPGVLMLVPGTIGFFTVNALLQQDAVTAVQVAFQMMMIGVAISGGLIAGAMVVPPRSAI